VATYSFTGTKARYYGFKRNDLGYADILVDDIQVASIDCYAATSQFDVLLYETSALTSGSHTLKIRVDGTKNGSSSGTEVICDAFASIDEGSGSTPTPSPTPTPTPAGTPPPLQLISQAGFSVAYYDSQETSGENAPATNAINGNTTDFWHTQWSGANPPCPHEIQIDLGATYDVGGVRYLPRQDSANGRIANFEIYVSTTTSSWGTAVASGTWPNSTAEQEETFTAKSGRYVRLRALSEVNGNAWTSVAELNVLEQP
jgi:hypothetical protein